MPVYLIRAGSSGPVKIGHARNPISRMRGFQTAHYEILSIVRTWTGAQPEEAALHRAFSDYRMHGEWFRFCEAMLTADPALLLSVRVTSRDLQSARECTAYRPNIRIALKAKSMTQKQLAAAMGCSEGLISQIISGEVNPTYERAALMEKLLGVPHVCLFAEQTAA